MGPDYTAWRMEREADGKFKTSALPAALPTCEDASGAGITGYDEPVEVEVEVEDRL